MMVCYWIVLQLPFLKYSVYIDPDQMSTNSDRFLRTFLIKTYFHRLGWKNRHMAFDAIVCICRDIGENNLMYLCRICMAGGAFGIEIICRITLASMRVVARGTGHHLSVLKTCTAL